MEKILCAAIWLKDANYPIHTCKNTQKHGAVLCGYRHNHIIGQINALLGKRMAEVGGYEHGFLTSENRFLNREQAYSLADTAGQIIPDRDDKGKWELYSEDLY
jgi:hypothetical protein